MGQFLDYLASVFSIKGQVESPSKAKSTANHVTFADSVPFGATLLGKNESERTNRMESLGQSNKKIIYTYMTLGLLACLAHFILVSVPTIKLDTMQLLQADSWQHIALSLVPLVTYFAAISAMYELNRPVVNCVRLTSKSAGLDLRNNQFGNSLKLVIFAMMASQLVSAYSNDVRYLWSTVPAVSSAFYLSSSSAIKFHILIFNSLLLV